MNFDVTNIIARYVDLDVLLTLLKSGQADTMLLKIVNKDEFWKERLKCQGYTIRDYYQDNMTFKGLCLALRRHSACCFVTTALKQERWAWLTFTIDNDMMFSCSKCKLHPISLMLLKAPDHIVDEYVKVCESTLRHLVEHYLTNNKVLDHLAILYPGCVGSATNSLVIHAVDIDNYMILDRLVCSGLHPLSSLMSAPFLDNIFATASVQRGTFNIPMYYLGAFTRQGHRPLINMRMLKRGGINKNSVAFFLLALGTEGCESGEYNIGMDELIVYTTTHSDHMISRMLLADKRANAYLDTVHMKDNIQAIPPPVGIVRGIVNSIKSFLNY